MEVRKRLGLRSTALLGIPLMAILVLAWGQVTAPAASASGTGPEMTISVSGPSVDCSGGECDVDLGGEMTVTIDIVTAPVEGYVAVQTFIDYGMDLTYVARPETVDEFTWPDSGSDELLLRGESGAGEITHGSATGLIPPLPLSSYTGTLVEIDLVCSDTYSRTAVRLMPAASFRTSGTQFAYYDETTQVRVPVKTEAVTVNCGDAPPPSQIILPDTGTFGATGDSGFGTGMWAAIGALLAIGAAGLSTFGLRVFAGRRVQ
ncbi:MAG: hypothetical protein ACC645_27600 [Pirellulales bacterium]